MPVRVKIELHPATGTTLEGEAIMQARDSQGIMTEEITFDRSLLEAEVLVQDGGTLTISSMGVVGEVDHAQSAAVPKGPGGGAKPVEEAKAEKTKDDPTGFPAAKAPPPSTPHAEKKDEKVDLSKNPDSSTHTSTSHSTKK